MQRILVESKLLELIDIMYTLKTQGKEYKPYELEFFKTMMDLRVVSNDFQRFSDIYVKYRRYIKAD
jgi:hypothetical protein